MGQQLPTKCKTEVPLEHWQHVARPSWNMLCFFCSEYRTLSSHYLFVIGIKRGWSFTMKQKDGYCTSKCWRYTAGNLGWHATPDCNNAHAKNKRTFCISQRPRLPPASSILHPPLVKVNISWASHRQGITFHSGHLNFEPYFVIFNVFTIPDNFLLGCFRIGKICYVFWNKKNQKKKHLGHIRNALQTICKWHKIPVLECQSLVAYQLYRSLNLCLEP